MSTINLSQEIQDNLVQLQALKQIATGRRITKLEDVIADLLELKKQLPYYLTGSKKLDGIASHNKKSEKKRKRTLKNDRKKTTKKRSTNRK